MLGLSRAACFVEIPLPRIRDFHSSVPKAYLPQADPRPIQVVACVREPPVAQLRELLQIAIGVPPIVARGSGFLLRELAVAALTRDQREREMAARVGCIVVEHLTCGVIRELPIAHVARYSGKGFKAKQRLRPCVRAGQGTKSSLHVLQQRTTFLGLAVA